MARSAAEGSRRRGSTRAGAQRGGPSVRRSAIRRCRGRGSRSAPRGGARASPAVLGGPEAADLHEPATAGFGSRMNGEAREHEVTASLDRLGLAHGVQPGAAEVTREPFLDLAVEATRLLGREDRIAGGERHRHVSAPKLAVGLQAKAPGPGEHGQERPERPTVEERAPEEGERAGDLEAWASRRFARSAGSPGRHGLWLLRCSYVSVGASASTMASRSSLTAAGSNPRLGQTICSGEPRNA